VTTVADLVAARAEDHRPGVMAEHGTWTWAEAVQEGAARGALARSLFGDGLPHIGVLLPNGPEYLFWLNGAALAGSAKNRHEHQLVIDTMRSALEPLCDDLTIAPEPQLSRTATVWHLCTPISGRLRDKSTTAIDLALALHPTPAVGGVPTKAATELIAELEGDRGFYAGAAGWCDASGDGRWVVSIRGAQLSADRRTALARAGGGIVAESDPDDEVDETTTKFATILNALGVEQ